MQNWAECNSIYNRHSQQFLVEDKVRAGYPSRRTPRDPVRALIWQDTSLVTQATPLNGRERGCIRFQKFSFIRCSVCYSSNSNDEMSIFLLRIMSAIDGSIYSMKLGKHLLKYNQVNLDGRRKINLHWRVKICKKKKKGLCEFENNLILMCGCKTNYTPYLIHDVRIKVVGITWKYKYIYYLDKLERNIIK